jgi:hypothetical protein
MDYQEDTLESDVYQAMAVTLSFVELCFANFLLLASPLQQLLECRWRVETQPMKRGH